MLLLRRALLFSLLLSSLLVLSLQAAPARAQELAPELDTGPRLQIAPQERARLQAVLDAPVPRFAANAALQEHFRAKDAAAFALGDNAAREAVLRQWQAALFDIDSRWTLASYLLGSEKIAEGFTLFEDLIKDLRVPNQMVRARARLAVAYMEQNKLPRAAKLLEEAEAIIQKSFPRLREGSAGYWFIRAEMEYLNARGRLLSRMGQFDQALQAARLAIDKGHALQPLHAFVDQRQQQYSRANHAWAATEMASIQINMSRWLDADESLRLANALYRDYGLTEDKMLGFLMRVSDLRFSEGNYAASREVALNIRQLQRKLGYAEQSPSVLWNRFRINRALVGEQRWQEAAEELEQIDAAVGEQPQLQQIARQVRVRAMVYMQTGRLAQAQALYARTLDWHERTFGESHYFTALTRGLYAVSLARGSASQQSQARPQFEQAVRDIASPNMLSVDYRENAITRATRTLIFETYLQLLSSSSAADAAQVRDAAAPSDNDAAKAFAAANHLIASSVEQAIADAAARAGIHQPGVAQIARQDQIARNELSSLYAYITEQSAEGDRRRNPDVVRSMRARIAELEQLRRGYRDQIQKEFPEYFQLLQPRPPSAQEIAARLAADEVFVSILTLKDQTYVFALTSDGRVGLHKAAIGEQRVGQLVAAVRATLDVAGPAAYRTRFDFAAAHEIYRQLLLPLGERIRDKSHLIVAASGALGQLPFSVLPTAPWNSNRYAAAPWLVRSHAISHIPSSSAWLSLKRLQQQPSADQPLMAWGDPLFDASRSGALLAQSGGMVRSATIERPVLRLDITQPQVDRLRYSAIPPLPDTRDEVLALARSLGADVRNDVLLGRDATRESVLAASADGRLQRKRVVVFATHGLLAGDLPRLDQPALAMAATPSSTASATPSSTALATPSSTASSTSSNAETALSPLLTLEDVLGLKLNADWVVLSACNTAGADGRQGEAMSGLARGFFYAGSRSLLVTHWSVESESAKLLTTSTFAAYQSSPAMTRSRALRHGMLVVMALPRFEHPAFWAPYALVGEGGR